MALDYNRIHKEALVADLHCDTLIQMKRGYDFSERHNEYHVDIPRLVEGGVGLQVFACCPRPLKKGEHYFDRVSASIDLLKSEISKHSDKIEVCLNSTEAGQIKASNRIAALLAIEGGVALDKDPQNLERFYKKGIRLFTITHNQPTGWCANWKEKDLPIGGLSDLGREIIFEMNRLGIIIDLSHSSDATFDEVLKISKHPVIASHSNSRSLCDHLRNLTDDQIKALAEKGGMVGVTFVSQFLSSEFRKAYSENWKKIPKDKAKKLPELFLSEIPEEEKQKQMQKYKPLMDNAEKALEALRPSVKTVVDHIDHMVNLAGPDYVGIGSDYDGMSMPPLGLEDCSKMPNVTKELAARSYSLTDIKKILGGNFRRVFKAVCG
ncbi:MAG: dipeptidase [Candidatus Zixiibacteriota bacterium]